jgi:hypothetical protein
MDGYPACQYHYLSLHEPTVALLFFACDTVPHGFRQTHAVLFCKEIPGEPKRLHVTVFLHSSCESKVAALIIQSRYGT